MQNEECLLVVCLFVVSEFCCCPYFAYCLYLKLGRGCDSFLTIGDRSQGRRYHG